MSHVGGGDGEGGGDGAYDGTGGGALQFLTYKTDPTSVRRSPDEPCVSTGVPWNQLHSPSANTRWVHVKTVSHEALQEVSS